MYADGFTNITNIDYSPAVIETMSQQCHKLSRMDWRVMDITDMRFDNETFDVVIEKGTLDALLVSEDDPWNISTEAEKTIDTILGQVCLHQLTFCQIFDNLFNSDNIIFFFILIFN